MAITLSLLAAAPGLGPALAALPGLPDSSFADFLRYWIRTGGQAVGAVILLGVLAGAGKSISAFLRLPVFAGRATRLAGAVLIGFGAAAAAALAVGVCGLFHPKVTFGGAILMAVAAGHRRIGPADLPRLRLPHPEERGWAGILAALLMVLVPFGLAPQTFVDTLAYHAGAPAYWSVLHKSVFAPHARFQYPLLEEQVIAACAGLLSPEAINLAVFGSLLLLLAGWAARRFGTASALLGTAGFLASAQSGFLIGHVKHDPAAAAFLLLGFAYWDSPRPPARNGRKNMAAKAGFRPTALATGASEAGAWRVPLATGAALGLAFAAKYTAIAPAAGMLAWHLAGRTSIRAKASFTGALAVAALVAAAPFILRTWLLTGNPIQPFYFTTLGWSPECSRVAARFGCPGWDLDRNSGPAALLKLGTEHAPLALLGLPLLALVGNSGTGFALAAAGGGIAVWAVLTPCFKFMLPALPLLNMAGAAAILSCPLPRAVGRGFAGIALALGLIHAVEQADFASRAAPAGLGLEPRTAYLARRLTTCFSASGRLRITEPNSARALLIGDARGALFNGPRAVLSQDISDFPLPLKLAREARDPDELAKRFRQLGIRLVVLNYVTSEFAGQQTLPDFAFRPRELARYAGFWERWTEPIPPQDAYDLANGGFAFYRIRRSPVTPVAKANGASSAGAIGQALVPPAPRYPFLPGTEALAARMPDEDRPAQVRRLHAILQFVPRVGHLETRLGALVLEEGNYREAERLLRRGMECGFEDAGTWGCLGLALKGQRRFAEAAGAFARAARLMPETEAYRRLAKECLAKGSSAK